MIADLIVAGDHFGRASISSAAMPAMCGVDIEVPDRYWKYPPNEPSAGSGVPPARMLTPGAETSGLIQSGTVGNGPREEKRSHDVALHLLLDEIGRGQRRVDGRAALELRQDREARGVVDHHRRDAERLRGRICRP